MNAGGDNTPLVDSAVSLHEAFLSLLEAGFTEHQALYFLACMVAAGQNPPSDTT